MVGDPAHASGDPRPLAQAEADRVGWHQTARLAAAVPSAVSSRARAGAGTRRQQAGRWQAPRSVRTIKTHGCPGRAMAGRAGTGDRPGPAALRGSSLRWQRWVLPGR